MNEGKNKNKKNNFWADKKQKSKIVKGYDTKVLTKKNNSEINDNKELVYSGIIISNVGNNFEVMLMNEDFTIKRNTIFFCKITGAVVTHNTNSKSDSNLVVVGDKVLFERMPSKNDIETFEGVIKEILLRKKFLSRKAAGKGSKEQILASNISNVIVFMSADSPPYNKRLLDRYLIVAEQNLLNVIIVINKVDLFPKKLFEFDFDIYKKLGYDLYYISLKNKKYKNIIERLKTKITNDFVDYTVITGPSGVGKSSFINYILEDELQDTNEISVFHQKGIHTTSSSKLFLFENNSGIIDSPGIREFGLWQFDTNEIRLYFHEFDEFAQNCKYYGCTHNHEPSCAVKEALENELIDSERYQSYINLLIKPHDLK